MIRGQLRYSLLNPDPDITPLKFRGWFRKEAERIQAMSNGPHDMIIIRIFLPKRMIHAITQRKLDNIFQAAVDRLPNVHRVELEPVEAPLTPAEMHEAAAHAQEDLDELIKRMAETIDETPPTIH